MMKLVNAFAFVSLLAIGYSANSANLLGLNIYYYNNSYANTNISGNGNLVTANNTDVGKLEPRTIQANTAPAVYKPGEISLRQAHKSSSQFDREVEIERLRKLEYAVDGSRNVLKAFRGYKEVAKKGNLQGYIEVGRLLVELNNSAANADAYEQFSIAARKDYAEGIAWQGWMHASNRAPKSNPKTALDLYNRSAQKGNAWAMYRLGVAYETAGLGVHRDMRVAIDWYWKAARLYFGPAVVQLAWLFDTGDEPYRDRAKALKFFELGARLNQPYALTALGFKYAKGDQVINDFSHAAKYYERAANLGDASAQNNLGNLYLDGKGVAMSPETAVSWYRKAALQSNYGAFYNLGYCYRNGIGVTQNLETAVYWYRRAADLGYEKAQFDLGLMYRSGEGVQKNIETAISWFNKSAERNYSHSIYQLAYLYANGKDVKQDFVEAAKWLRLGVKLGNAAAMNDLAAFIERKNIEPQPGEDVLELYKRSADAGNPTGMVNYGKKLAFGYGVDVDINQAISLLEKGRNAKVLEANLLLAGIYANPPNGVDRDLHKAVNYLFDAALDSDDAAKTLAQLAFTTPELFTAKDREKVVDFLERVAKSKNVEDSEHAKLVLGNMLMLEQWKPNNPVMVLSWLLNLSDSGNTDATALLLISYLKENMKNTNDLISIFGSDKAIALLIRISQQPGRFKQLAEIALEFYRMGPEKFNSNIFNQRVEQAAITGDGMMVFIWATHLSESYPEKAADLLRAQVSSGDNIAVGPLCSLLKTYRVLPVSADELKRCF